MNDHSYTSMNDSDIEKLKKQPDTEVRGPQPWVFDYQAISDALLCNDYDWLIRMFKHVEQRAGSTDEKMETRILTLATILQFSSARAAAGIKLPAGYIDELINLTAGYIDILNFLAIILVSYHGSHVKVSCDYAREQPVFAELCQSAVTDKSPSSGVLDMMHSMEAPDFLLLAQFVVEVVADTMPWFAAEMLRYVYRSHVLNLDLMLSYMASCLAF